MEPRRFADVWWYYANLIDYLRIALCVAASVTIAFGLHLPTAGLLLASILLDWVDGPVARAYGQCTLVGYGLDWFADLYTQILFSVWLGGLAPMAMPALMLAAMASVGAALLDFALTTAGHGPRSRQGGLLILTDLAVPNGSFSRFGTFLWLAWPLFVIAWGLDLGMPELSAGVRTGLKAVEFLLFLPAILSCLLDVSVLVAEKFMPPLKVRLPVVFNVTGPATLKPLLLTERACPFVRLNELMLLASRLVR